MVEQRDMGFPVARSGRDVTLVGSFRTEISALSNTRINWSGVLNFSRILKLPGADRFVAKRQWYARNLLEIEIHGDVRDGVHAWSSLTRRSISGSNRARVSISPFRLVKGPNSISFASRRAR